MECFICLNDIDISQNNFYLKCCNNYLHNNCIKSWINHNKNTNNNICPYCRTYNNDMNQLICQDIDIIIIDNNYNNYNIENNNYHYLCSFILTSFCILFFILFFPF